MRVGYVIGALDAGGSERQLCELAVGMKRAGHHVEVLAYDGPGVLDDFLRARGVALRIGQGGSRLEKLRSIRRWFDETRLDVAHGFMKRASGAILLASLPWRRPPVVASDLSTATYSRRAPALWGALVLFAFAKRVATQTELNKSSLLRLAPWLRGRVVVVRNGCDLERFHPSRSEPRPGPVRFLCCGTAYRLKNPVGVVKAAALLREAGFDFTVDWVGSTGQGSTESPEFRESTDLIGLNGLHDKVRFLGRRDDIENVYSNYDALVHVSLQDGIPNAVVEAMACGLPVVVSRVSDLPLIVAEGRNGMVCDETNPADIAAAMREIINAGEGGRRTMGERSRSLAERWFDRSRFVRDYERLYAAVVQE